MGLEKSLNEDEKDLTIDRKVRKKEKGSSKCKVTGEGEVGIQRTPNLIPVVPHFLQHVCLYQSRISVIYSRSF